MVWGVKTLSVEERYRKAIDAGTDLIGSDGDPAVLVELVKGGAVRGRASTSRCSASCACGSRSASSRTPTRTRTRRRASYARPEFQAKADVAQRRSIVLLKNDTGVLPLRRARGSTSRGSTLAVAARYGYVSTRTRRLPTGLRGAPRGGGTRPGGRPRRRGEAQRAGGCLLRDADGKPIDLTVPAEQLTACERSCGRSRRRLNPPHRPLRHPGDRARGRRILATFGVSDEAAPRRGHRASFAPTGRLPFELPSSMDAVRAQKEDVPYDSAAPLFPFGAGLTYAAAR